MQSMTASSEGATPQAEPARLDIDPKLLIENWQGELDAAALYRRLAGHEKSPERAAVLREIAQSEDRHAEVMAKRLAEMGVPLPRHRTGLRVRVLGALARIFGTKAVLPVVESFEASDVDAYASPEQDPAVQALIADERSHFRVVGEMARPAPVPGSVAIARHESWHRTGGGGTLRATIFGVNDGLVSNLALVMGFAGARTDPEFVLLAGIAGLLAGACSMGAGEYVSMRAQRELFERQIALEESELILAPEEERAELALIYRAKGVPADEAERLASRILENREVALETLAREELGLDPSELGSPWGAAIGSFVAFAAGAILPVIPYFTGAGWLQFAISAAIGGLALLGVGVGVSLFTGRNALYSGARQLAIGAGAAAITFGIGTAIGVGTGI
jgi:VIT1/CCC1 family predicted Fe2+/Mn2+ transporter